MFIDVSKFDIITSKIEWKIYNLNELKDYMDNEQFLSSKEFYNTNCPSIVWEMRLYPNLSICTSYGRRGGPRYSMSTAVSLFKKGGVDNELKVKYKIYAINADLKNVNITLDGFDSFPKNNNESTRNQIELESLLHSDGSILLYCEVNLALCEKNLINNRMTFNIPRKPFIDMYKQGILTDCVIKIGNEKINAHRCVLANNSEVFRKMFEQKDMLEAKNGEVNIIDSSPECVRTMIEYFYNGEINKEILEMLAHELFVIAHKYEIISLMDICEHIMASKVDANSFAENLKYIHIYNLPILEKACVTFITTNRMTFLDSKEWKDLKQLYKDKAIDLLEAAFKNC